MGDSKPGTVPIKQAIKPVKDQLSIVPANLDLASTEINLVNRLGRENVLKNALSSLTGYELILIDTPPQPEPSNRQCPGSCGLCNYPNLAPGGRPARS